MKPTHILKTTVYAVRARAVFAEKQGGSGFFIKSLPKRRLFMKKYQRYEEEKQKIIAKKLSSKEYEKAIKNLRKKLKV